MFQFFDSGVRDVFMYLTARWDEKRMKSVWQQGTSLTPVCKEFYSYLQYQASKDAPGEVCPVCLISGGPVGYLCQHNGWRGWECFTELESLTRGWVIVGISTALGTEQYIIQRPSAFPQAILHSFLPSLSHRLSLKSIASSRRINFSRWRWWSRVPYTIHMSSRLGWVSFTTLTFNLLF